MTGVARDEVERAVAGLVSASISPLVLAVSGGLDSMVLMHAMLRQAPHRIAGVATFDHGSGDAATRAADHVERIASAAGCRVFRGRAGDLEQVDGREASWRRARLSFLESVRASLAGSLVTAHTEDDQVETVLMRVMRRSGARGLAGLYAFSPTLRPFVRVRRHALEVFARRHGVSFVEDPTNASREHLRNRVRLDILPALRRIDGRIDSTLLDIAQRAAELRQESDELAESLLQPRVSNGRLQVSAEKLPELPMDSLRMLWTSAVAGAGLVLDRRGAQRIASFVLTRPRTGTIPIAGGWTLEARGDDYIVERDIPSAAREPLRVQDGAPQSWGNFRFRIEEGVVGESAWCAALPPSSVIRSWTDGDRLGSSGGQQRRRVKRYLSDAGVKGGDRRGWPVVVAGDDVVWIPGVRRSDAATERSGRPVRHCVCERIDR
jgi:tRNA(Ile)-lysidine synthase